MLWYMLLYVAVLGVATKIALFSVLPEVLRGMAEGTVVAPLLVV
jgi:hypothetical protein